jgi:hypothetical protein
VAAALRQVTSAIIWSNSLGMPKAMTPRLRLYHEVTCLLLAGGVEPLTAAEIEDLGLESPWDETEVA